MSKINRPTIVGTQPAPSHLDQQHHFSLPQRVALYGIFALSSSFSEAAKLNSYVQGDHSGFALPFVNINLKVAF